MAQAFELRDVHEERLEDIIEELTRRDVERLQAHRDDFVELPCAACRGTRLEHDFEANGFEYKRCASCGLLMLSPAPDPALQLSYIETSEALRYWREHMPEDVKRSRAKMYEERARHVEDCLHRHDAAPGTVLEIGAGSGEFAEALLRARGSIERMVLVEPQPLSVDLPRAEVVTAPIERWSSNERFGLAVTWEVIEHLLEPDIMLEAVRERLEPGGLLILSTPNEDSFETRLLKGDSTNLVYDHVRLYNPRTLTQLLERVGFEVLEVTTPGALDVEIVQRAYRNGRVDLSDQPAVRFLMEDGYRHRAEFQQFLCEKQVSGHMRCTARRPA